MKIRSEFIVEAAFLFLVFFLVNIRSFVLWDLYPNADNIFSQAWREVIIWIPTLLMMSYLLEKQNLIGTYLSTWLKEPLLIIFVLFSLASALWSDMWTVTFHRSLVFAFASAVAIFLGLRYSMSDFLKILYWFGATIVAANFLMIFLFPAIGLDFSNNYNGAWRGIFWHKNQLGGITSIFNFVFLFRFFSLKFNKAPIDKILAAMLYSLSLVEIFFARSAAGYVLVLLLHFAYGAAFLWLKTRSLLRSFHYRVILAIVFVGVIGIYENLDFILSLLNKEASFTGRVPFWLALLRDIFPRNPWLGKGFGTIWADASFRIQVQYLVGWSAYPAIGDNGFLDILLNLGAVGLVLFLLNYIKAWIYSVRFFLRELTLEGFFPFIFMIYTFFANLTFSLFMETEVFVWMLIVALMIVAMRQKNALHNA